MSGQQQGLRNPAENRFVRNAMRAELLSAEDESTLAFAWRRDGDQQALHRLTSAYMRLVIAVARRYKGYGLPEADLIQEGAAGLMQAANRYEAERGLRFSTYATWWVRASIQDYILRNWSIVRLGSTATQKSLFFKLRGLRAAIGDLNNPVLGAEARASIAKRLQVKESEVEAMAVRLSGADPSLNAPLGSDGDDGFSQWQDMLVDPSALPEAEAMAAHDDAARKTILGAALGRLNERERMIILARRAVDDPRTLESLGQELGVTKERVRQIEHAALDKLRKYLEAQLSAAELQSLMPDV